MSSACYPPSGSGNYKEAAAPNSQYDQGQSTVAVEQLFSYHPANPGTGPKYDNIREAAKYFAKVIIVNTPPGSDRSAAIRKLREAVMTANAGIALGGLSL